MATATTAQCREQEREQYNAYLADCPGHQLLATLSDKWFTLVLSALADGPQRYGVLSRRIAGASQKMLTQTLRKLERDGLVVRTVTPSVPVRVDYELTALGESLLPVQRAIKKTGPRPTSSRSTPSAPNTTAPNVTERAGNALSRSHPST